MARNWQYAVQETVQTNGYVPFPADVRTVVGTDHPLDGPSVYWNYERHSHYVVLSARPLQRDNYVDVGRYKIYDADSGGRQVRIRPPDRLSDVVRSNFTEGNRVAFLAYEEMTTAENPTVYLLSAAQLLSLLPGDAGTGTDATDATADGGKPLEDAILTLPGFLPPL